MEKYKISIIDSFSDWEKLSQAWNELLIKASSQTIFLTWEWLFSWAEIYLSRDRQLFIVTVSQDGELLGVAPWYIDRTSSSFFSLREIAFLGSPEADSDYLDVIIIKGKEKKVTQCIYDFLFTEGSSFWDCFSLRDIPAESLFLLHFLEKIEEAGKYAEIGWGSFCPSIALPGTNEAFLAGLSSHHRMHIRRYRRMIGKEENLKHHCFLGSESETSLDAFLSFHRDKKGGGDERFFSLLKTFARKCRGKNWVQIDMLSAHEKPVAGFFHFRYRNVLHQYIMVTDKTFNPKVSIGNILVGLCIEKAISHGISSYDFLKGTEQFKFSWANGGRRSLTFFCPQRKIPPLIFTLGKFVKAAAKIMLR